MKEKIPDKQKVKEPWHLPYKKFKRESFKSDQKVNSNMKL